jgi:16S rRNA (cytosine967-C5)-methyltransferase
MRNSLAVAIEALSWMAYAGLGERTALFRAEEQLGASPHELRQAHRLIMETTRYMNRLDHIISSLSIDDINDMPHGVSCFLRILAYLRCIDEADNKELMQTIFTARQVLGWKELRPYEVTIGKLASEEALVNPRDEYDRISLDTCHPLWYVHRVLNVFGRDLGLRILNSDMKSVSNYLRQNTSKNASNAILNMGSEVEEVPNVRRLDNTRKIHQVHAVRAGDAVIQDLSAIVAGLVASPQPGELVLDVCAAPGNKTSHLASMMGNRGEIVSVDVSVKRMIHWKREVKRLGCTIAHPLVADASRIQIHRRADLVLVDPPCSNTGVFAKNPSTKWRITPSRLHHLVTKQADILQSASESVCAGGRLVYSTCSILPEENEEIMSYFLSRNPNFVVEDQIPFVGSPGLNGFEKFQRFYTHLHDCNGYFIAKVRKRNA